MKKEDLIPSYENICSAFLDDSIGRNEELMFFVKLLDSIHLPAGVDIKIKL